MNAEKKRPEKSPKTKNYEVMEVKIPPMVRTGHPKQRRGPKKVTFAIDEKPGNPEDIDPVSTPTPSHSQTINPRVFSGKKPKKNMDYSSFIIDIQKVRSGEEPRLTLMLKNIPNG